MADERNVERSGGETTGEKAPLVLVVDDVADGREIVGEYLKLGGYEMAGAADGLEAVQKAHDLLPDVILMDVWLPKMDGLEATRRLKQDERTRHIPIIALTAHGLATAREKAMEAGCDAVITKPFLPDDLEREIRKQLDRTRRQD
ncbi:MAG TPA: response regulator [Thermoanaerobaculia bacterium]|nr:response regulator [Thermoanaerobaculia bacterium]